MCYRTLFPKALLSVRILQQTVLARPGQFGAKVKFGWHTLSCFVNQSLTAAYQNNPRWPTTSLPVKNRLFQTFSEEREMFPSVVSFAPRFIRSVEKVNMRRATWKSSDESVWITCFSLILFLCPLSYLTLLSVYSVAKGMTAYSCTRAPITVLWIFRGGK